jgi:uncharacterized protein (AIM24 family)
MFMDRFAAPKAPGLLLLHAGGNAFTRHLAADQSILIKPTSLLFKDPTVQMRLHFEYPATAASWNPWASWNNRHLWVRLSGPGRVAVQSAYGRFEDNGRSVVNHSGATEQQW